MSDRVRSADPDTSKTAAAGLKALNKRQQAVLAMLAAAGPLGLTDYELTERFRWPESTARKRRCELVALGKVVATGERREIATGSRAHCWAVAPEAGA